jgi:TATA-box binding protein (TBP) (component of TFIID and TFIIIB)
MTISFYSVVRLIVNVRRFIIRMKSIIIPFSNIVCTTKIPLEVEKINLKRLARKTLNVSFNMGKGPSILYRYSHPTMTCSLYDSGSIIHCGGKYMSIKRKRISQMFDKIKQTVPELKKNDITPNVNIVNTLTTIKIPYKIDVLSIINDYSTITSYFKENFTGCTLSLYKQERSIKATIFPTGSINLTGCVSAKEREHYAKQLRKFISNYRDNNTI